MSPSVNPVKPREAARSRSRADAARNHDAVVNAARRVFAQRGLGVSMVEVARAAGVGVGTVYRCFPTKEALHLAVIEHGFDGLSDEAAAALADPDPGAAFFGFLRHAATVMARDRAIVGMARGGFAGSARPASVARLFDLTDELLARAEAAGAVRAGITAEDVSALLSGVGDAANEGGHPSPEGLERYLAVLSSGLRPD